MVVIDSSTNMDYELWDMTRTSSGAWQTAWGAALPLTGDGVSGINGTHGATGSGLADLGGVIRTSEIAAGHIDHALAISSSETCSGTYRAPAIKTDGGSTATGCVPEGARLQLDPSINVDALPGLTPAERTIAHALQTYGAYVRDSGGTRVAIICEVPNGSDPYPAAGLSDPSYAGLPDIPWSSLRVLRNWNGS